MKPTLTKATLIQAILIALTIANVSVPQEWMPYLAIGLSLLQGASAIVSFLMNPPGSVTVPDAFISRIAAGLRADYQPNPAAPILPSLGAGGLRIPGMTPAAAISDWLQARRTEAPPAAVSRPPGDRR